MNNTFYYSVRMHASGGSKHLSGAERLITTAALDGAVSELVNRAMNKALIPDRITVTIDCLGSARPRFLKALDVTVMGAEDCQAARMSASGVLKETGVSSKSIGLALELLIHGAAPSGQNMRGAVIMNAQTGERLEPDKERGVRASRFDWGPEADHLIRKELAGHGLSHFRTREALALATKVAYGPGVVAELCWSDDPDYTAGYVASRSGGYVRFPFLKQEGDARGGRVIFIDHQMNDIGILIDYLQNEAILIDNIGTFYDNNDKTCGSRGRT